MAAVTLPVLNASGEQVGSYDVDVDQIVSRISKQLLHDAVVMYQACARQGTFASKTRAEVAGTTKKMYRQKGTGNARAGSRRAVQRRGGGHAFAKKPRDFSFRMPKKAVKLATKMAIRSKIEDSQVIVVDDFGLDAIKTAKIMSVFKAVKVAGESILVATAGVQKNVYMSARNIPLVEVLPVSDLNAYAVLRPRHMVVTRAALDQICGRGQAAETASSSSTSQE
jgi:large subunit ribosomal protein L4